MKLFLVYVHINKQNGKRYYGITSQTPNSRWRDGKGYSLGYTRQTYFYNAIEKYGWDGFHHEIIAENLSEDEARKMEAALIAKNKSNSRKYGYNLTSGGDEIVRNAFYSDEEREKRRLRMLNRKVSHETAKRISESRKGIEPWNKGKKMSEDYKRKISETHGQSKRVTADGMEFPTITKCAEYLGVTRKTLAEWLNGKRDIPRKRLYSNIKYLDI